MKQVNRVNVSKSKTQDVVGDRKPHDARKAPLALLVLENLVSKCSHGYQMQGSRLSIFLRDFWIQAWYNNTTDARDSRREAV